MDRYRKKTSSLFTRLAGGLSGRKPRPAISRSPAPQTSLSTTSHVSFWVECQSYPLAVFVLPDELILSILFHVAPDTQYTSHWVRFRLVHNEINDDHIIRVRFLRRLSATCKAMRLRLAPWLWEHLELSTRQAWDSAGETAVRNLNAIANALRTNTSLTTSVKYFFTPFSASGATLICVFYRFMTMDIIWNKSSFPPFVKCLQSLPNLHTLEIGWVNSSATTELNDALTGAKLPQIKTLILPHAAHPLLQHCRDVEDVVCIAGNVSVSPDEFLGSLPFWRDSKVKRLAIPLVSWVNPSRKRFSALGSRGDNGD